MFAHGDDEMIRRSMVVGLLGLLLCTGMSCTGGNTTDVEALRRSHFVNEETFLSITNGSSLADANMRFGPAVRHQFTAVESGHTWTLIKCFLHTGPAEAYTFYQLLFRDGVFVKTIGWIQMEREEYPYRGATATRSKPWDIEDTKYVTKAIEAPAVTADQIRAKLKDARATMEKHKGEGNIPKLVGHLFAQSFRKLEKKGYPDNERLRQQYDGCKVAIGMTRNQVDELYGHPVHKFTTEKRNTGLIYGDDQYLGNAVDSFFVFSYVAVLVDPEGRVVAVYSDGFFCKDWYPGLPAWRHD